MMQRHEGWMFLSHSSKDFELVRRIRNTLEDHGFRPITFFLKCITDSTELDGLIKREIEARRWFVFVDSENSRSSKWAQEELAYAKKLNKKIYTVDTTRDYLPQLNWIMRRTNVMLTYHPGDLELAARIRRKLIENDFQVWWYEGNELREGDNPFPFGRIDLVILTASCLNDPESYVNCLLQIQAGRHAIPIVVGEAVLDSNLQYYLEHLRKKPYIKLCGDPDDAELDRLIEDIVEYQERNDL